MDKSAHSNQASMCSTLAQSKLLRGTPALALTHAHSMLLSLCFAGLQGSQKISFQEFKACLEQIARDKHTELSHLENTIITSGGPMINTTCV